MSLACATPSYRIDAIACGRAVLGVAACPGGGGASLASDLEAVAAFRPDAIVTLMSAHELRLLGCEALLEALPTLSAEWHHMPLRAGAAPDARFKRLWTYAGHRLRQILQRGGRVLIHCDVGGLRARWLASRLLVEMGAGAHDAGARARLPRAEAMPQLVSGAAPLPRAATKILGCLFGGALGDALGYPIEFRSWSQIRDRFGEAGLAAPLSPGGRIVVSDDTQMTLFTAEGLLDAVAAGYPDEPAQILARVRKAYLAWFRTQREEWSPGARGLSQYRELWAVRAPGSTCLSALHAGGRGTPTAPLNDSKGSGALVRVAPLGLVSSLGADAAFDLAHGAAALTHGHPAGRLSGAALASLIHDLVADLPMAAALGRMEIRLERMDGGPGVLRAVKAARSMAHSDTPAREAIATLGQGWSGDEALAIGLYAVLRARSFEEAVRIAANHDGDSDTTAAVAGQIWGAAHGVDALPADWIRRLDVLEPLCDIAGRLIACGAPTAERAPTAMLQYRPTAVAKRVGAQIAATAGST